MVGAVLEVVEELGGEVRRRFLEWGLANIPRLMLVHAIVVPIIALMYHSYLGTGFPLALIGTYLAVYLDVLLFIAPALAVAAVASYGALLALEALTLILMLAAAAAGSLLGGGPLAIIVFGLAGLAIQAFTLVAAAVSQDKPWLWP